MADQNLQNLFEGLKIFKEGLTQYNTAQAVNDATKKVQDLHAQQLDEQARLQANQQIGQELALRMTAAGAAPAQVQTATDGMVQSAGAQATNMNQRNMQASSQSWQSEEKELDRDLARELAQRKSQDLLGKKDSKFGGFITRYQEKFNAETKDLNKGIQSMDTAEQVLQKGNPIGDQSVGVMFARASGDVGAVSDYAEKKYGGVKALSERIEQAKEEWSTGKLSATNRKFMIELAQEYKKAKKSQISARADHYAAQAHGAASKSGYETDVNELRSMILPAIESEAKKNAQAQIQVGQEMLAKMPPNDPRRAAVEAKIKKLQEQNK